MKKKTVNTLIICMTLLVSGCVTSKIEYLSNYKPDASRPSFIVKDAVEEYHFISWEPYHFLFTLGILPQYGYVIYRKEPGKFEKHSTMIGWLAIPMPLLSSWKYGHIPDESEPNKKKDQDQ